MTARNRARDWADLTLTSIVVLVVFHFGGYDATTIMLMMLILCELEKANRS